MHAITRGCFDTHFCNAQQWKRRRGYYYATTAAGVGAGAGAGGANASALSCRNSSSDSFNLPWVKASSERSVTMV